MKPHKGGAFAACIPAVYRVNAAMLHTSPLLVDIVEANGWFHKQQSIKHCCTHDGGNEVPQNSGQDVGLQTLQVTNHRWHQSATQQSGWDMSQCWNPLTERACYVLGKDQWTTQGSD